MPERVCVIGAGASGMTASIAAARCGAVVTVLERRERVGKKLLLTGNGKCNFTNRNLDPGCFHASRDSFAFRAISDFGLQNTVNFFEGMGVIAKEGKGGCIYPRSEQASGVQNALRGEMNRLGVRILTDCKVKMIRPESGHSFSVLTDGEKIPADRVILAAGSPAGMKEGTDIAGYELASALGHTIHKILPALCPLFCAEKNFFRETAGVRTDAEIRCLVDGTEADRSYGEMQLTSFGLSGIPVFQISRTASIALSQKKKVTCRVNFLPEVISPEDYLKNRLYAYPYENAGMFGNGLLNKNLWSALLKEAGIKPETGMKNIRTEDIKELAARLSASVFTVVKPAGFENAQSCTGGVSTEEINPHTMESLLVPGLYFAGEMMDVDGLCGGYNLQWAWTSGMLAGLAAAGKTCSFETKEESI